MTYIKKDELKRIKDDYKRMKTFLVKNRLLESYIKTNKSSRAYFDRRIKVINKMMISKTR